MIYLFFFFFKKICILLPGWKVWGQKTYDNIHRKAHKTRPDDFNLLAFAFIGFKQCYTLEA
jgi:hypothetical protein